jgi:epoxyqueuosine reductase QueG
MLQDIKEYIVGLGADLAGFADLTAFPPERRQSLPYGISIAIAIDPAKASLVLEGATMAYYDEYELLNKKLDTIGLQLQSLLISNGYSAVAQTVDFVKEQRRQLEPDNDAAKAPMPHKTVAALAGLGWIGKNTLLITDQYGSAVRLTSVLTNAPLPVSGETYRSRCGGCQDCVAACPGHVIRGISWTPDTDRDELIDFYACRKAVLERGRSLGISHAACGICMAICPHTRIYLRSADDIHKNKEWL